MEDLFKRKQQKKKKEKQSKIHDFNKVPILLKIYNKNIKYAFDIINLRHETEKMLISMEKQISSGQPLRNCKTTTIFHFNKKFIELNGNLKDGLNELIKTQDMENSLEMKVLNWSRTTNL